MSSLHVIIPAGGAGTRLWPLSRASHPKFLIDLTGSGRTLLQQTWDRLAPLAGADRVHVVTGAAHVDGVREQLPDLAQLLVEPAPRDSMPAIGLAAAVIARTDPEAIVGSFAADQTVADDAAFAAALAQALAAAEAGYICTIGVTPTEASTAYGYIDGGDPLGVAGAPSALSVRQFVEKPDAPTAQRYLEEGSYSWNAGMFVAKASVLLDHLARLQPELHAALSLIAQAHGGPNQDAVLSQVWPSLPKLAIDHAIAEPVSLEGGLAVVPAAFGWSDVGDFAEASGSTDDSTWVDADGLVFGDAPLHVAVVGLHDVVVVRTGDAVLITTRERAQDVKQVVAQLKEAGRDELL
jgi:mannose-1-phosphate guanylyltransferase